MMKLRKVLDIIRKKSKIKKKTERDTRANTYNK